MKRITWKLSLAATLLGCGLILFAGKSADPLDGWKPLNAEIEKALGIQEGEEKRTSDDSESGKMPVQVGAEAHEVHGKEKVPEATGTSAGTAGGTASRNGTEAAAADPLLPSASSRNEDKPAPADSSGKININQADRAALMDLPGIGEKKAQAIMNYRDQHGPFRKESDLLKVKGIGPKMLEKMKPYILL